MRGATLDSGGLKTFLPFQSTLLMRGATQYGMCIPIHIYDFNPRSSCEERRIRRDGDRDVCEISIHAPHARSDAATELCTSSKAHFNPRSSCEERLATVGIMPAFSYFNPRSSCEERQHSPIASNLASNFNPRSSCEERPVYNEQFKQDLLFQSTLLMRGATSLHQLFHASFTAFQSTLLMRGATACGCTSNCGRTNFNPRSSCEERPQRCTLWPL